MTTYGGRGNIAQLLLNLDPSMEVSGKLDAPTALLSGKDL
jgi:hypothetical protein